MNTAKQTKMIEKAIIPNIVSQKKYARNNLRWTDSERFAILAHINFLYGEGLPMMGCFRETAKVYDRSPESISVEYYKTLNRFGELAAD